MLFTSASPYEGMTPKEKAIERLKRHHRIMVAVQMLQESADKAYVSKRGYMKPQSKADDMDWKDRVESLRLGVRAGKSRMREKGRSVFRGR